MFTTYLVVADAGLTWTPETFYAAAAVAQLILILLVFRILGLSPEYNNFVGAAFVVIPTNAVAFFTRDIELVGVLAPAVVLFAMLAAVSRGDMIKSGVVWVLVMASYLGMAHAVIPRADDLRIEDLGGIPQVMDAGGLEPRGFSEDDIEALSGRGGEER